jgi:tRNA threonylcarbamoyl adenosine modification protein YeaZ
MILGLDTSVAHCAIGLMSPDGTIMSDVHEMAKGQAEALFPLIEALLTANSTDWSDITRIGVGIGPGNFTGVRLGVSAARGLALACNIPAIGVSRLATMAYGTTGSIIIALDARRDSLFVQRFYDGVAISEPAMIDADLLADFAQGDQIIGDTGLACFDIDQFIPNLLNITQSAPKNAPRPAPLYLRAADAALPSDPIPTLLT